MQVDPERIIVDGSGLRIAVAGMPARFTIHSFDKWGNISPSAAAGVERFHCELHYCPALGAKRDPDVDNVKSLKV